MRQTESHGMFDVRNFKKMDAVLCAGLGGGSLIYANVFLRPPDEVFDDRWPASCKKANLEPYYAVAKEVLGARPIPQDGDPRRRMVRTELFQQVAKANGRTSHMLDINVFFGNDFDKPLPIGQQDRNRYGAVQTSCVYCAECDAGCNYHSKNTIDLNYLYVAEHRYKADVRTEHLAQRIVPAQRQRPGRHAGGRIARLPRRVRRSRSRDARPRPCWPTASSSLPGRWDRPSCCCGASAPRCRA